MKIQISPGTMGIAALCVDLFGVARVDAGSLAAPVYVHEADESDAEILQEYLHERAARQEEVGIKAISIKVSLLP